MAHGKGLRHGQGSCKRAIDYLLGDHDHKGEQRGGVDVLRGDPYAVAALADSLKFSQRYTSYVYGWAPEEAPTAGEIDALVDDWAALAFAGMERDRVMFTVIQHTSAEGKIDLHIIVARVDIETGKSFNPCPPGSLKQFDQVRDLHNWTNGWARPDDPDRARLSQPGRVAHGQAESTTEAPRTKPAMLGALEAMVDAGELTTGTEVRDQARQWGEVTREGADYISVKPPGPPGVGRAVRLQGEMFKLSWSAASEPARKARKTEVRSTGRGGQVDLDRAREAQNRLNAAIASRAAYNQRRYPPRPAIDPDQVMAQLRAEQQVTDDRNRAIAAAAANLVATAAIHRDQRVADATRRIVAAATGAAAEAAERNQQLRATTERAVAAARATTDVARRVVGAAKTAAGTAGNTAAAAGCAGAAALAATAELRAPERTLRALARYCRAAVHRLRAVVEQRLSRVTASIAGNRAAPAADRSGVQRSGGWAERFAGFREWAGRAADALNAVIVVPEPQSERRGAVFMWATSAAPYQPPSAEEWAELLREWDSRPEPTADELAELMLEGVTEQLEEFQESAQGEDEIDLDDLDALDDKPSGPSLG